MALRITNVAFFHSLTFSVCYSEADLRCRSQSRRGGRHPWARYLVAEEAKSLCQIQPSCSSKMSQSGQVPSHVLVDYHSGLLKHLRPGYWTLPTACMAGWLPEYHQPLLHCALYLRNVHQDVQSWLSSELSSLFQFGIIRPSRWAVVKSHTVYFMRSTFKCHTVSSNQPSYLIHIYEIKFQNSYQIFFV